MVVIIIIAIIIFVIFSFLKTSKDTQDKINTEIENMDKKIIIALQEWENSPDFQNLGQFSEYDNELLYQVNSGIANGVDHRELSKTLKYSLEKFMEKKGLPLSIPSKKETSDNYTALLIPFLSGMNEKNSSHYCLGVIVKTQEMGYKRFKHLITINFLNAYF